MGKHLKNIVLFLALFLVFNSVFNMLWGPEEEARELTGEIVVETTEKEYRRDSMVTLRIVNNSKDTLSFPNECPGEPFIVNEYVDGEWQEISANPEINCEGTEGTQILPGETVMIPYTDWNNALFYDLGRFKIQVPILKTVEANGDAEEGIPADEPVEVSETKIYETSEFTVIEESLWGMFWGRLFYLPIYNTLIFFISIMPGFNLGLAIILLTLLIRTILLVPSHRALRSQKRLQEVQPKIEAIRKKYEGDQQKIASETMALWKGQKVSPFSSCLPLLIQFPVLIALFYAVQSGLRPDSAFTLYEPLQGFDFTSINPMFLGLDLTKLNLYILPFIIGGLQFVQMKLSMARIAKKKTDGTKNEMQMATNMMTYFMPVLIAVFTASLPAAVGIYWGTSTLYGIIQQFFINREKPKESSDVKVKVIER